ncbi:MAG: YhdP family protein [Methylotenera sp.]
MTSLKKLSRWVIYLFLLLLVIFMLAALAVRFVVFPNIDQYKDDIAAYASQKIGQKITIGDIETGWDGISPHFSLKDIELFDAESRSAFHLNNAEANISWLSIPLLHPHLSNLVINQPEITIRRKADGSIYLAGIDLSGPSKPEFANWLLSQREVSIKNAQVVWLDDFRQAPPLSLKQLNLTLSNPTWRSLFGRHQFELSALPSTGTNQAIAANGHFVGRDVSKLNTWHGELSAQLKQADLSVWRPWLDYPVNIQSGTGDAQISLDFADAKIEKIKTHTALNNLSLVLNKQATPLVAKQFTGDISWSDFKNTKTISAENIKLSTNTGLNINNGRGYYSTSTKNGKPWVKSDVRLDQFNLATIKQLSPYVRLPENFAAKLNGFSPVGELQALILGYEGEANKPATYKINTTFKNLGLTAYQKIPGFSNLTGKIEANEDGGEITLQSQKATLDLKDILRWPIPADKLNGHISWKINGDKATITAKDVFISSPHITGTVNASYDMSGVKGGNFKKGFLDLNGKFGKGNAKFAPFYYPIMLGKPTLHWLDTSILEGRAEDVNLTVKGNLADFPYVNANNQLDKKLGLFRVTAKISDVLLEYGTGWPVIEGLGLDMLFEGKRMVLNANKGHIFGNRIIASKTEIAQLDADSPMLHVVSDVEGPVTDGVRFVNESPVKLVTQGFTDDLKTAGNGKLNLELKIPLQDLEAAKYKGVYKITNGTIYANADAGLPELSKLNGVLNFTENSLAAQNVSTEILGGPAQFSLRTGADKIIHVSANGRINDAGIKKLASNVLIGSMQGSADWTGDITIKQPLVDVNLRSNLAGIAIQLPPPFNKPANQEVAFSITKKQPSPSNDSINISYGNAVSAKILRTEQAGKLAFERGDIGVNIAAELPAQAGLSLHGKLDHIDADDWLALFNKPRSNAGTSPISINSANIAVQKLDIFGRRLNALKLTAQPSSTGLQMAIDSQEISGNAEWQSAGNGKVIARLKNLTIPNSGETASKPVVKKDIKKLAKGYPALDVIADNFQLGNKKLGTLELNAVESSDDWVIQKLKITNPDSTLSAEGNWHNWTRNPNTSLKFSLSVSNIGNTLKRFGQPDAVKGGEAAIAGQLQWSGSPHEFDTNSLNGNFKLDATKGQILKVQPGVGRLFGLLSLQSLPRRLSLDFRDLFSDGFAFDKISANAKIDNGIMRSDDFFMTGPAAETKIKGETNLKTETQRLKVKVTPHVSDSLSLAALAGGPIAGAAAFVAQKILKDPFNKIASSEYTITGTWDKPQEVESEKEDAQKPSNVSPLHP